MISYGSQHSNAATPFQDRSHQLGEGQSINTGMSGVVHPSRPVYGSQGSDAEMPMRDCSQGEGHSINTEMSYPSHPSRPVYGSQSHGTAMSHLVRSHQLGEGQSDIATMPEQTHPSRPVYGSQSRYAAMPCNQLLPPVYGSLCYHAAMPIYDRSHLFTRGQTSLAEMSRITRLSREGSGNRRRNANAPAPFPVLGHPRYAERPRPLRPINFNQRPNKVRRNAFYRTPRNQGDPIWIQYMKTRL